MKFLMLSATSPHLPPGAKTYIPCVHSLPIATDLRFQDELNFRRGTRLTMGECRKVTAVARRPGNSPSIAPIHQVLSAHVLRNTILFLQYSHNHQ